MIEQDTTSRLKIRILPLQEKDAVSFIAGALSDLTFRHNVVAVPNTKDTEDLAQKLHSILGLDIVPVKDFDNDAHANSIIYQQHFDTLCNATDNIKGQIKSRANHEGARNFSKIHNQVHQDETCPYYQQNMTMSKLYRKGGFFTLITSVSTMINWDFAIKNQMSYEISFTKNLIIWFKDRYRENQDRFKSTIIGKTQGIIVGHEEYEYEDDWGHLKKGSRSIIEPKPIQMEYAGEEISGYKRVKDSSFLPIKDSGWVKETESNYMLPSKLSLVILNALSQGYHWDIDVISVHADIFREEVEPIDDCEIEFPPLTYTKPKIVLVNTEIPVNLAVAQSPKLTKSLPVIKQYFTTIKGLDARSIDIAFLHFNLINLGNAVKSRAKDANKVLERYSDLNENLQEIKNLRHNYLIGPNSNWNNIPMKDPQNALYDELLSIEQTSKSALIYGTPRFINKGYSKGELKLFHSLKTGISLPAREETKEFFEKYCKRLAYLLNLYGIEKTYIVDPYFQYGLKFYSALFTQYFDVEMM